MQRIMSTIILFYSKISTQFLTAQLSPIDIIDNHPIMGRCLTHVGTEEIEDAIAARFTGEVEIPASSHFFFAVPGHGSGTRVRDTPHTL